MINLANYIDIFGFEYKSLKIGLDILVRREEGNASKSKIWNIRMQKTRSTKL